MKFILSALLSMLVCSSCFAERYIQSTKYDDQEEVLVQGASIIFSKKTNDVLMYQTTETLDRTGNFYFSILNNEEKPINFYFANLQVTDQWGRPIKVINKHEQISKKKREKNWKMFASGFSTCVDSINAQKAGTIEYQSHTDSHYRSNVHAHGSNGWVNANASGSSCSTTYGTVYSEALRQQALRQVQQDAECRNMAIQANCDDWENRISNFYFDSTTIFSSSEYGSNFQIDVPKQIEKDLQYLLFTFYVGSEKHTFCFYCGEEKKKWYEF